MDGQGKDRREIGILMSNGATFCRPEERVREYCEIEVYRDVDGRVGYDDHHNVSDTLTREDLAAADNLYAHLNPVDYERILGNRAIPLKLAAVKDAELGQIPREEWEGVKVRFSALVAEFLSIRNVKLGKTMRILHLKRPHLVPILDPFVVRFLTGNDAVSNQFSEEQLLRIGMTAFETARIDLISNREPFVELQQGLTDLPTPLSAVRLYDILCWTQEKWVNRGDTSAPYGTATKSLDQTEPTSGRPPIDLTDPSMPGAITSVKDFRQIVFRAEGVMVVTSEAGARVHRPECEMVSERRFQEKVIINEGRTGRYFWRRSLAEARKDFGAVECPICRPGNSTAGRAVKNQGSRPA